MAPKKYPGFQAVTLKMANVEKPNLSKGRTKPVLPRKVK